MPETKIGWAIDAELVSAIAGHRDVDYIHACPRGRWRKAAANPARWPQAAAALRDFAGEIREAGYEVSIDAQGLLVSALIPFAAGIKRRIGFAHRRELSHLFYTEKYVSKAQYFDPHRPHAGHMLALAGAIGCAGADHDIALPAVAPHVRDGVAAMLGHGFAGCAPLVAIAPGTRWASKQWPAPYWEQLLEMILNATDAKVVLIGSGDDAPLTAQLARGRDRVLDLAGKTSLPQLYALLSRVPIVIAADTAPLHAAGAAHCAHLIGLYGPTPAARTGPLGSPDIRLLSATPNLSCQPCRRPRCRFATNQCMRAIAPSTVFAEVVRVLRSLAGS